MAIKTSLLILLSITCLTTFSQKTREQSANRNPHEFRSQPGHEIESKIMSVIKDVYPACVFLADYDTVRKARSGSRFSGVVVSEDGLIMTAAHVSFPGKVCQVIFPDGKECIAIGLGRIGSVDAALMKIKETGKWPYAPLGWSSSMNINETCISIAYPGTFAPEEPVIRVGYLADTLPLRRQPRLRTTCLMEPGDSGGPIFDIFGRVVGVCSSITLPLENNYEVPVDVFRKYWTALNAPQSYRELPQEDPVPVDPLKDRRIVPDVFPDVNNYFGTYLSSLSRSSIHIKSEVKDTLRSVTGTAIAVETPASQKKGRTRQLIVSKSSMVGEQPVVSFLNGKEEIAAVLARDVKNDLVLLEIKGKLSGDISKGGSFMDTLTTAILGKFLLSPLPDISESEISVLGSREIVLPRSASSAQLGVNVERRGEQLFISRVADNTAAREAKLEAGDEIISVDGVTFTDPRDFSKGLQQYEPGDKITLTGKRNDSTFTKNITLRQRLLQPHIANEFTDGRSDRRNGFENAFIHDAKIRPQECGGPVFDSEGRFMGINIARASRTSSIAIPATAVWDFVERALSVIEAKS